MYSTELLQVEINAITRLANAMGTEKFVSLFEKIFSSKAVGRLFTYLLERKACTALLIEANLGFPEQTAYRALNRLMKLGVIKKANKLKKATWSKGGPRPILWITSAATYSDVSRVTQEHYDALSPRR